MYKILLLTEPTTASTLKRQTPNGAGCIGDYRFYINEAVERPDFLVVRDKAFRTAFDIDIAPENTLLVVGEPRSVVLFPDGFVRQFGKVLSCQPEMRGANVVHTHAILPWYVGTDFSHAGGEVRLGYDDFKTAPPPVKTRLLSVITSNKIFTRGHQRRLDFVRRLQAHYGDRIDVFGRGLRDFGDKWEVLAPYKYHIAIENSTSRYYWTEKLTDCFLTDTFPVYYGCTNAADYFPSEAFAVFDLCRFDAAVRLIDALIARDAWEASRAARAEAKALVLDRYNLFHVIAETCRGLRPDAPRTRMHLRPARDFFSLRNTCRQLFGLPLTRLNYSLRKLL